MSLNVKNCNLKGIYNTGKDTRGVNEKQKKE